MSYEDAEPLTVGLVAHHAFCPRRAWLEVHGEKTDTAQVAQGVADHAAVDDPSTSRTRRLRAVDIHSESLGLVGRCDSIEFPEDGPITVVEHKASPVRRNSEVTEPQRIQLALQALCLREQGFAVAAAAIWFTTTKRRVSVNLDDELIAAARAAVRATRDTISSARPPAPFEDDWRCRRCSHASVCLPEEHLEHPNVHRIGVSNPAGRILHLASAGSRASLRRGQIEIRVREEEPVKVPVGQVTGLVVHGNADVSSALIRTMLENGYPIVWCAWSGRVTGWACPASGPNGDARARQFQLENDVKLATCRAIIASKLRNQAALLRRHDLPERTSIRELSRQATSADSASTLLGLEGAGAKLYFHALSAAFKPEWATVTKRTSRPALDQVNAALNLAYALLLGDVLRGLVACGLDPSGGVLHSPLRNKPALALDLMEEMRAPVADSAVVWAINNGELREQDFRREVDVVRMTEQGRKALIAAYERRAESEFRHPQFGYSVTWRRAMEVQARMFLGVVLGEVPAYKPIETR